ncbi:hypothetical protein [Candidatus Chromulinivorax destructor]|uniref:Uncharacterized protein n=1 Tax=Candidatus Chromulinivorax destructor TaxID=2066483 RepID=A0A345ZCQ7_9BACT|nr:hypothetical protein [Candidatus Chromulinivorax destructor]AXK61074.1 hypothetical protein C0J27_05070 [Candidatus Chromulinivorax destructor]
MMNKIFLIIVSLIGFNSVHCSQITDDDKMHMLNTGLIAINPKTHCFTLARGVDKAIVQAICNGADDTFVLLLVDQSRETSKSIKFNAYMAAKIKSTYQLYDPTIVKIKDDLKYATTNDDRSELNQKLQARLNSYKIYY